MTINGSELVIETGRVAKQSNGSVMISHGDTVALVTACAKRTKRAAARRCWLLSIRTGADKPLPKPWLTPRA